MVFTLTPGQVQNPEVEQGAIQSVSFDDIQGVDEAKEELKEIVDFLKNPQKYDRVGGKLPKGVLLSGPPGTGKTFLAKAIAGEAGVPFFQMSGSEFDELYVGVGARRIRDLFNAAKLKAPCIVFIDELDAVGSKRNAKDASYARQTLNQLLVQLDGFESNNGVIFIGATNTPETLDKALVRPGRFDKHVVVPLPDVRGRCNIIKQYLKPISVSKDIEPMNIARGTPGFSGADLANLVNQAAIQASKLGRNIVKNADMEYAKDKIMMGVERKSALIKPKDKRMTAIHEGGHALVSLYNSEAHPLHKVTVIPRGLALGVTMFLPEEDYEVSQTKKQILASIDVSMGGRAAEELIYGPDSVTTGAYSDLKGASSKARAMIMHYGMSSTLGLACHDLETMDSRTKALVEEEVKQILDESYSRVKNLLLKKRDELENLANALVDYETLTGDEVRLAIKGGFSKQV